jgi:threonine dehydrogenase-like Zn-dependent dehydrogenase
MSISAPRPAMRFPLPAGALPEAVAAGVNPGMASWLPLRARQAEAAKLGTVLILGVTGMSGFLAAQNARLLGATRVVGSGRSQPGLERAAAAGAQTVAITGDRDTDAEALAKLLDGDPPGLVLDFVWGTVAETAFAALARDGFGKGPGRHQVRPDRRAGGGRGRRSLRIAAQQEAHDLRERGRLGRRGGHQGPDPGLHPADRRRLRPGAVPHLPLSGAGAAWTASAGSGPRVVLVPDQAADSPAVVPSWWAGPRPAL